MKSCVKACGVMAAVLMAACGSAAAQVIISEVVSGSMLSANPKFVELTNVSATQTITLGATDTLRIYSNTNTTSTVVYDFGANEGANNVTLSPGQSWTIALGGSTAGTSWTAAYGANQPNLFLAFPGGPAGNGNDVYELQIAGVRSDIYGIVPGNPGATTSSSDFSMPWAYSRGYAKRLPNVCVPNATFTIGEWAIGGNNSLGTSNTDANAQAMATNTTPNSHANICLTGNDCNGNGRPDATDIATGTSQDCNANAVPDACELQGTVRTFTFELLDLIEQRMKAVAEHTCAAFGATCEFEFTRNYPPTINHVKETEFARRVLGTVVGADNVVEFEPTMGAEDFSFFLQAKPGCYFMIGNGDGAHREGGHGLGPCMLHNPSYDFNDELIPLGATAWVRLAEDWLAQPQA